MVNNLINNLFADFIHVAKVMNYTYNATIQPVSYTHLTLPTT